MLNRRAFLSTLPAAGLAAPNAAARAVRHVDIIHHSHTDVGFTDMPSVCRDMQVRFLSTALDACLAQPSFRWTCEATLTVDDWWRQASPARREQLLAAVRRGQMDVMALPFNQAPFMDALEWRQALDWLPPALFKQLNPRAAMQNDVNGLPRAGALLLHARGVRHLLMGINSDSGGPPFRRPTAFHWELPGGKRMFVWMGEHYGTAYGWFEPKNWIRQQPKGGDTRFRAARPGDFHKTDEASLRAAHAHFTGRLAKLEAEGYDFPRLILSYTGQWRYDNDSPLVSLPTLIDAWNKLGLEPTLRLTTTTTALFDMEKAVGARLPVKGGEWTDWWANGDASGPREVAASRVAKRHLAAALSPVWGPLPATAKPDVEKILKDLCLFDEHTWGANESISRPDSLFTRSQYNEKSLLAYRPMGHAEWLLGRRARTLLDPKPAGLYLVNTAEEPWSGWIDIPQPALRDSQYPTRFWAAQLPPAAVSTFTAAPPAATSAPTVETDAQGWPKSVRYAGAPLPLCQGELGDFITVQVIPPADRGTVARLHRTPGAAKPFRHETAAYSKTVATETPHTLVFTQKFEHPRLQAATRSVEIWKDEPRARVAVRFTRISSRAPELIYFAFASPIKGALPEFSNGGVPFTPFTDQLEGSCRDYFAIDNYARYVAPQGAWLWVTEDAPLVAVGGPHPVGLITQAPPDSHRLLAMVFDNCWHTNFVADEHGEMEFHFHIAQRAQFDEPARTAATLTSQPAILLNPATREAPEMLKNLFRP